MTVYIHGYEIHDRIASFSANLNFSGLVKAKKYDWKDSNMALFGSDTEKQVKSK